jgi:hypothetical protein
VAIDAPRERSREFACHEVPSILARADRSGVRELVGMRAPALHSFEAATTQ